MSPEHAREGAGADSARPGSGPVVIAYDGSDLARRGIQEAGRLLSPGRDALVVCVWQPFDVGFIPVDEVRFNAAQAPDVRSAAQHTAEAGVELAEAAGFRARGLESAHIVGNSLGGWVALELGRLGAARSVTCLSPAGLWRKPIGPSRSPAREWARRLRPLVWAALHIPQVRLHALATFAAFPTHVPIAAGREMVLGWIDADGYDGANKAMREHVFDPTTYPTASEVPVTIAWAEQDRLVGPPREECRPAGARFLTMPHVGHVPMWDDPDLVARVILEGSSRVGSRAAPEETVPAEGGAP